MCGFSVLVVVVIHKNVKSIFVFEYNFLKLGTLMCYGFLIKIFMNDFLFQK